MLRYREYGLRRACVAAPPAPLHQPVAAPSPRPFPHTPPPPPPPLPDHTMGGGGAGNARRLTIYACSLQLHPRVRLTSNSEDAAGSPRWSALLPEVVPQHRMKKRTPGCLKPPVWTSCETQVAGLQASTSAGSARNHAPGHCQTELARREEETKQHSTKLG